MRERDYPGDERHYSEHPSQYPQEVPMSCYPVIGDAETRGGGREPSASRGKIMAEVGERTARPKLARMAGH